MTLPGHEESYNPPPEYLFTEEEVGMAVLSNNKILNLTKFYAFADNNINAAQKLKFDWGRVESILRKGENVVDPFL